jgi:glutamate-5-semialdehyde dehydrogenase
MSTSPESPSLTADDVRRLCQRVRAAGRLLAKAPARQRRQAIEATAAALLRQKHDVLRANEADLSAAAADLAPAMLDRLRLNEARVQKMAQALHEVAALPDPVGEVVRTWRRDNGLIVSQQRIPLGVLLIIYEARPNVTTDAGALCLKSGNAVILRGGSEAHRTNRALGEVLQEGLRQAGLPEDAVLLCPSTDRRVMTDLLTQDDLIDLVIPRGGEGLIRFVAERSRIPVIKHYRGNCHIYVEQSADLDMALSICENAKVQRPSVCNAVETILVDRAVAEAFLPRLFARLSALGVELRGDARCRAIVPQMKAATEEDFYAEFLDLICAVAVVDELPAAVAHIERYGSDHTEAIVTTSLQMARRFTEQVNSSTVVVNASTRFADGGELGLGAEIGISTTRLHAYGPMGAEQLTTTKFVVMGEGQIRG